MRKISWVKVNTVLMFEVDREEAIVSLKKKYPLEFPIWRLRSRGDAVELLSYEDIVTEYATSGRRARLGECVRKNNLLWGLEK